MPINGNIGGGGSGGGGGGTTNTYKGTWDASTNTPTLANGVGTVGDFYINIATTVEVVNFGAGGITFNPGDQVRYNGTIWQNSGGNQTAATTPSTPISGVSGANVQDNLQSLADEFVNTYTSGEVLSAFVPVSLNVSGQAVRATADTLSGAQVVGFTLSAVGATVVVSVQVGGEVTNPAWTFDVTKSVWLDVGLGAITQTPPSTANKHLVYLGVPSSATKLMLSPIGNRYIGLTG